jgi:hypothetical protein
VTVLFAEGLSEIFDDLPEDTKRLAARSIELLSVYPRMYPVRRRVSCVGIAISLPDGFFSTIRSPQPKSA